VQQDFDELMKDYNKMEVVNIQQEKILVGLENTCNQQQE
jgi:hypothetical protein